MKHNRGKYPEYSILKESFYCDFKSGTIYWRMRPISHFKNERIAKAFNTVYAFKEAGTVFNSGYRMIQFNKKHLSAHRIVYFLYYGFNDENDIDHIDRDTLNNSILNLRPISKTCSNINRSIGRNNTSGVSGVSFNNQLGKWKVQLYKQNKYYHYGYFENFDDAVKARWEAECEHNWNNCLSSSTAYKYLKENNLI